MTRLFTIKSEYDSALKLGFKTSTQIGGVYADDLKDDIVIRWGNSYLSYKDRNEQDVVDFKNVINPAKVIRTNCQKHLALNILSTVVLTPSLYLQEVPKDKRVVLRFTEHSHGSDFSIKEGGFKVGIDSYATEFIETDEEYRVWFCGDKTFYAKRVPLTKEDRKSFPCRSNWGYSYRYDPPKDLYKQVMDASKVIGLEVGAADVLKKDGKYYFLELNSAPSIDTKTLIRFFKEGLKELIKTKFPNL